MTVKQIIAYIITEKTKAIMALDSHYYRSKILDENGEHRLVLSPEQLLKENCLYYGSSLKGRREAIKRNFGFMTKIPIVIDLKNGIFMFPTSSVRNTDCIWLNYYSIHHYEPQDNRTYILFKDGTSIFVNASYTIIDMQHKRMSQIIAQTMRNIFKGKLLLLYETP